MRISTTAILALTASFGVAKEEAVSLCHYRSQQDQADRKSLHQEKNPSIGAKDGGTKANKERYYLKNHQQASKGPAAAAAAAAGKLFLTASEVVEGSENAVTNLHGTGSSTSNNMNPNTRGYGVSNEEHHLRFSNQGALVNGEKKRSLQERGAHRKHKIMIDGGSVESDAAIGTSRVESTTGTSDTKKHDADIGILSTEYVRMLYADKDSCSAAYVIKYRSGLDIKLPQPSIPAMVSASYTRGM